MILIEVLVLYYTRGGRTEALARAAAEGVNSVEGASAKIKHVNYATAEDFISEICDQFCVLREVNKIIDFTIHDIGRKLRVKRIESINKVIKAGQVLS